MPKRDAKASAERILEAAADLLQSDGWPGFGVNPLVERAGLGKPLLYRYFGGREGLEKELRRRVSNIFDLATENGDAGGSGELQSLIRFGRAFAANRLARDWLAGALAGHVSEENLAEAVETAPPNREDAAQHALLLAGIAFLLIWRDQHDNWIGVPLKTAKDLAQFEYAVAALVGRSAEDT